MREVHVQSLHRVEVRDKEGSVIQAIVELRYRRIRMSCRQAEELSAVDVDILHATERNPPKSREAIDWKLVTDLPITSRTEATE